MIGFRPQSSFARFPGGRLLWYCRRSSSSAAISVSAFILIHAFTLSASKYFCYASDLERQHQLRVSQHSYCPLPRHPARRIEVSAFAREGFEPGQLQARGRERRQGSTVG